MNLLGTAPERSRTFQIPFNLTSNQRIIDVNSRRFTLVRAGRKFGKTTYALYKTLKWLGPPNSQIWYLCATYKQAKLIAWQEFKRLIPPEALKRRPNDTDLIITLKNGSELYLIGTDEMDTIRGLKPKGVVFEEAAMHKREVWHEVVRPNLLVYKAPALFISTPKGYNWFKDLEDEAKASIRRGEDDWAVFHFSVFDNPTLDVAEIEKAKAGCDNDAVWRQEYMAEYESSVGRVFNAFSQERHVRPVTVSLGMKVNCAIDWGQRDDTSCLWGYAQGRKLFVYREHLESGLPPSSQASLILGKTHESVESTIISHDATKMDIQMQGLTVMWHFMNAGIRPIRPSSKDKKASRAMIHQLLQEDRLVIDPSCQKLIKQMLGYEWKDTVMEKTADGNDDAVDALHYLVELLQFKLFSGGEIKEKTHAEKVADYQREVVSMSRPKWPIDTRQPLSEFKFEDTSAGYFQ